MCNSVTSNHREYVYWLLPPPTTTYPLLGGIVNSTIGCIHILLSLLFLLFNHRELGAGELAAALGLLLAPFELLISSGSLLVLVALVEDESPID